MSLGLPSLSIAFLTGEMNFYMHPIFSKDFIPTQLQMNVYCFDNFEYLIQNSDNLIQNSDNLIQNSDNLI